MKTIFVAVVLAVSTAACDGNSMTSPSGTMPMTGTWAGSSSDSSLSMGTGSMMGQAGLGAMTWQLTQTGSTVTGSMSFAGMQGGKAGSFSGTMTGDDMVLMMTLPTGSMMSGGCSAQATGTARINRLTMTMTGTYSGSNTCTGSFMNGQMIMTRR